MGKYVVIEGGVCRIYSDLSAVCKLVGESRHVLDGALKRWGRVGLGKYDVYGSVEEVGSRRGGVRAGSVLNFSSTKR